MDGIDQKTVVSPTVSSKSGKVAVDAVPTANQLESKSVKRASGDGLMTPHPDPTRFGDWEQNGRCIDF
jgi:hypothetical protein|tara:strand:- start:2041 stop:2244 length:204 start_codon:yes stop_codon:yes gene_type:complete